jgi:hypothetical protein
MYGGKLERRRFTAPTADGTMSTALSVRQKLMERPDADSLQEGFVYGWDRSPPIADGDERRIEVPNVPAGFESGVASPTRESGSARTCFQDFEKRFGWSVIQGGDAETS